MSWATRCKEGNGYYNLFNFMVLLYIIPEQFTRVSIIMGVATCNGSWWIFSLVSFSLVSGSTKEMENTIKICRLSADAGQRTCRSQVHRFSQWLCENPLLCQCEEEVKMPSVSQGFVQVSGWRPFITESLYKVNTFTQPCYKNTSLFLLQASSVLAS